MTLRATRDLVVVTKKHTRKGLPLGRNWEGQVSVSGFAGSLSHYNAITSYDVGFVLGWPVPIDFLFD
jgi:hypothetical protein